VTEVHCTYDPETRSGFAPDGRKVDATIHWLSEAHAVPARVRLYDRLFDVPDPMAAGDRYLDHVNPKSLEVLEACRVEPSLKSASPGSRCQFERIGYFFADPVDSAAGAPVFNRTVTLRDSWARVAGKK